MDKQLFSETSPPPQQLVETSITRENPTLSLSLSLFTVPQSQPPTRLFTVPPSEPPTRGVALERVQNPILESTLFQFHSLFPQSIPPPPEQRIMYLPPHEASHSHPSPPHKRPRKHSCRDEPIPEPYPWATNRRARVHSFQYLIQKEIFDIKGDVECKKCERKFEISFDVREKSPEIHGFILKNSQNMNNRAPLNIWKNPTLPDCVHCNKKNCVKPIIADKKKKINWLFLFLGQMLGCCNLMQLKYCCKYNNNHRTGAKDRVLYSTYIALCDQLYPN